MAALQLALPDDLLDATRLTEAELRTELALHLFQQEKLSLGKAAELADIGLSRFMLILGARDIPVHYDLDDYEVDVATIRRLAQR